MTLFGVDLKATMDAMNDWGKDYWGFILVMVVASYFVSNLWRNLSHSIWRLRNRDAVRLMATGRPFSPGPARMPRNFGGLRMPPASAGTTLFDSVNPLQ